MTARKEVRGSVNGGETLSSVGNNLVETPQLQDFKRKSCRESRGAQRKCGEAAAACPGPKNNDGS